MLPSNPIHLKHQNYQIQTGSITFFKLAVTTNQCFEAKSGPITCAMVKVHPIMGILTMGILTKGVLYDSI